MLPAIQPFSKDGVNSAANSNDHLSQETETNSKQSTEWIINPELVVSAMLSAESQFAINRDIANLVAEYLQNVEPLESLSIIGPSDWNAAFNIKVKMIKLPPKMNPFLERYNSSTDKMECVIDSNPFISAFFNSTKGQYTFSSNIVDLVLEYLSNSDKLQSLSIVSPNNWAWASISNRKFKQIKIPPEMDVFLQKKNPFTGEINAKCCFCIYIPSHYENIQSNSFIPLTPNTMEELAKNPVNFSNKSKYSYFYDTFDDLKTQFKHKKASPSANSYWIVMVKNVIPGSRELSDSQQQEFMKKGSKEHWRLPTVREAIICSFIHYALTGTMPIPNVFISCVEKCGDYSVTVSGQESRLIVNNNIVNNFIVPVRRFDL